jgi:hypothetical protein
LLQLWALTNPKNTLCLLFLVVLTAVMFLDAEHKGKDVYIVEAIADQKPAVLGLASFHPYKAKLLPELVPTRISSTSFSSRDHVGEVPTVRFFTCFVKSASEENCLSAYPLVRKLYGHTVNIHGP